MKKKIVFRSGSLRMGGLERVLIEVLQNIDRKKFDVYLLIEDDSGEKNIFEKDIPDSIKYSFLKTEKFYNFIQKIRARKKNIFYKIFYNILMNIEEKVAYKNTKKQLKDMGYIDVFIDYDAGATKYIENLKNIGKKVVWIHNSIPNLKKKESKIRRFGKRLDKYDKVVAICQEMKEEIEQIYPFLKGKVGKIYNPFNFQRILNLGEDYSELSENELDFLKQEYCVAVSRLDTSQKDYFTLLKAFKYLKEKGLEEKLYIVGDGPSRKEIEEEIKNLDLKDKVVLLGQKKNPYIWMKNSKLFIHSSKYEGFGLVLVEAAILGRAVVASDCKVGPKEILGNGKYGIVFPVGNSVSLSKRLEEILKNKNLRKEYELKSMQRAKDFSTEKIMREYEEICL